MHKLWFGAYGNRIRADSAGRIDAGTLTCQSEGCGAWYPIVRAIPRLTARPLREALTREFESTHRAKLAHAGLVTPAASPVGNPLQALKQHTIANFGFEWIEYSRFGWDDPRYNLVYEERIFRQKSFLRREDLGGKVVLDAGCGNGRYTYWAAQDARYVFGLDLGDGVESASANTATLENVQIIQGDIFNVPFAKGSFDAIFSIGVLMHTGDARRATLALAEKVRRGGTLSVHLYGKGNRIYEAIDRTLRRYTTRLSIPQLQRFTKRAYRLQRFFELTRTDGLVYRFVRLGPHPHIIFDWYAAPIATHHTHEEVLAWFERSGYTVLDSNRDVAPGSWFRRALRPFVGGQTAVTVKGVASR